MTTYAIDVILNIKDPGPRIKKASQGLRELDRLLYFTGAAIGAKTIIELGDAYTSLQNKLRTVSSDTYNLNKLTNETFKIAQENRVAWDGLAAVYARMRRATQSLGLSQSQTLELTDTISKSIKLSGATAGETRSVLLQLSQAFNKGKLDGDEFKSVMENSSAIGDILTKSLKVTRGELQAMSKAGQLTNDVLIRAFQGARQEIVNNFGNAVPTVAERFQVLKNAAEKFTGEMLKNSTVFAAFGKTLEFVADEMQTFGPIILTVAEILAVAFAAKAVGAAIAAVNGLTAACLANPILAAVAGVAALTVFIVNMADANAATQKMIKPVEDLTYAEANATGRLYEWIEVQKRFGGSAGIFTKAVLAAERAVTGWNMAVNYMIGNVNRLMIIRGALDTNAVVNAKVFGALAEATTKTFTDNIKLYKKLNAEAEAQAKFAERTLKAAQEQDEIQRKMQARQDAFAPSIARGDGEIFKGEFASAGQNLGIIKSFEKLRTASRAAWADKKKQLAEQQRQQRRMLEEQKRKAEELAQIVGDDLGDAFVKGFGHAEDALANFLRTGEFSFKNFTDQILNDLSRIAARQALLGLVGGLAGSPQGSSWSSYVNAGASILGELAKSGFATGGQFKVGGVGGTDSQVVAFRASPNETVTVATPQQQRRMDQGGGGGTPVIQVINSLDSASILPMLDSPGGIRRLHNAQRLSARPPRS